MPRSSRHKSHKQSKHSSKEAREYSDSEVDDVKSKESGSGLISDRALKDSGHLVSGEKRKLSSQVKEGKDLGGHRNGDVVEEYVSSKRCKEKAADKSNGGDRWNSGDGRESAGNEKKSESLKNDGEKGSKSRELKGDVKSRSGRRHDSGGDMKDGNGALIEEKEYNRSGSRSEKRKSEKEKDGKDIKELREKERGYEKEKKGVDVYEKEKKGVDNSRSNEGNVDRDVLRKPEVQADDFCKDGHIKRSNNYTEWPSQDETRVSEIDEKRVRKKKESIGDLDKYQNDHRDSEVRHILPRSERVKEGRSFDEKKKEGNYGDKYYDDVDRDVRYHDDLDRDNKHQDDKYRDDGERGSRHRDDGERDSRHRDDKYLDEGDRDGRRREDKHWEESGRETKRRDEKHRGDSERDGRRRDDKYREDGERDIKRKGDNHKEDVEKESRHNDSRHYDEADRDGRHKAVRLKEDIDRDVRHKEDKYRDDYERENRHRDKPGDDVDREKRFREGKYRDDRLPKDRSGDKSDSKRSRDENHSVFQSRKSSLYEDGDDRMSRYKDDHAEKHSSGHGRGDLANERGRPTLKITDVDLSGTHYRRQSSPSSGSHINNQYRHSKQDEPKFKDYGGAPNRELEKKHLQRDDTNSGDLAAERRSRPDARASPMPLMDKSPSIMSERRHSRTDVRRNFNVDDSGPRYGGSRDGRDFSGREARGSRDVAMETFPGDEFSQVDGDNGSVSSPFARSGHLSNSAKSFLPPPPFRTGVDSPLPFGTSDDDSRGKSNNRHRRLGDTNSMGRMQGNSWRGAPNWPSPVANGFMPFQHGPPPVGYHPGMQQFPAPPLFGVRPSMDLNHHGLPYSIPDPDRFSGHVRPMGWRNLVDDSCPPPMHGWEATNAAFNEDSHLFGRPDWDNSRNLPGMRTNNGSTKMGASEKQDILEHGEADENIAGQFSQHVKTQPGAQVHSDDACPPSEFVERETTDPSLKSNEILTAERESEKGEDHLWHAYLSKLDISADLTGPELYVQCANLHGMDQSLHFDGDESKILYLEEVTDGKGDPNNVSSTFIFTATDDSVFEKAMILYNKHKDEFKIIKSSSLSPYGVENTGSLPYKRGEENTSSKEVTGGEQEHTELPNISKEVKELDGYANVEAGWITASLNRVTDDVVDKSEGSIYATSNTSMEVQVSSDIEARDISETMIEEKMGLETAADSPSNAADNEMTMSTDATLTSDTPISIIEGNKMMNVKCDPSLISDVPEAVVMPESIESESVNLSRIHHSPESTH